MTFSVLCEHILVFSGFNSGLFNFNFFEGILLQ